MTIVTLAGVDRSARLMPRRAWERHGMRALVWAGVVALLLHVMLALLLLALPRGALFSAKSVSNLAPREATVDYVQNAMPSVGDEPVGGNGKTIVHADQNAAKPTPRTSPPKPSAPDAAKLALAPHGMVPAASPTPPQPAQKPTPTQAAPRDATEIRLNDWGNDAGQSGGDATKPSAPDPKAHNHLPPYPLSAAHRGETGTVVTLVRVLPNGHAGSVIVVKSSGWPDLDNAVVHTVMHWRFQPALANGAAVESQVPVTIHFTH